MKDKNKGMLHLLIIAAAFLIMGVVALLGIGGQHRGSARNIKLGLDLAGGVSITYQTAIDNPSSEQMQDTVYKLQKRVDNYSTEAAVYQEGSNRINVDIPGVTDANKILQELGKAGSLEFADDSGKVIITGANIATAKAATITEGVTKHVVKLELNDSGKKKFAEGTAANIGKPIHIVYDGNIIQSPIVNQEIRDGQAVIEGQESYDAAEALASTIRIGALPLELQELRSNVVGAKLGVEAINTSLLAGAIGFFLVLIFMIAFYRIPGVAASIALAIYVAAMLLLLNGLDVTLTLPGIAGIVLSIGMAVDANVIIFTRIKEELATGKTVRSSIKTGFDKALSAIVDGNVTTLIAAAVLWFKGSGTIKGFAQTLAIGIILSMITALFVTRFIIKAFYNLGLDKEGMYGIQKKSRVFQFVKNLKKFALISGALFLICIAGLIFNKSTKGEFLNYGLDFKGGTSMEVTFNEPVDRDMQLSIETLVKKSTGENAETAAVQGTNALLIKTKELKLAQREALEESLVSEFGVARDQIATESISAAVSDEMKSDAVVAVVIATICMLLYIWIRFKDFNFGASAVLALLHDVIVVFMIYVVLRIPVGNTFIACMLTIVGYSINSTIVIFDRIRENRAAMKNKDSLENVVNSSISQTISRSLNTSLTTLIMVVALAILGVDTVRELAIPLIAGIVCGAYTSICITGALWHLLKTKLVRKKA